MNNDEICTPFELQQFAYSNKTDAYTFARWVETKSNDKYTVVEKKLIEDAVYTLSYYVTFSSDINDTFKKKWRNTLKTLE